MVLLLLGNTIISLSLTDVFNHITALLHFISRSASPPSDDRPLVMEKLGKAFKRKNK